MTKSILDYIDHGADFLAVAILVIAYSTLGIAVVFYFYYNVFLGALI